MSIIINNQPLELTKIDLQLKQSNMLFGFDGVTAERTTSFVIPATGKNNEILGFGNTFHQYGDMSRIKIPAKMQHDCIVLDGYLHITSANSSEYKCIFTTGTLSLLSNIRNAGTLKEIFDTVTTVAEDYLPVTDAVVNSNTANIETMFWKFVRYISTSEIIKPSISMAVLFAYAEEGLNAIGVDFDEQTYPVELNHYRLIVPDPVTVQPKDTTIKNEIIRYDQPMSVRPPTPLNDITITTKLIGVVSETTQSVITTKIGGVTLQYLVQSVFADEDMQVQFPDDLSADFFLIDTTNDSNGTTFLGGYSFVNSNGTYFVTGEPLAGRLVDIPAGTAFLLVDKNYYINANSGDDDGWVFGTDGLNYEFTARTGSTHFYYMGDNIPDMDCFDYFLAVANLFGKTLYFRNGKLGFDDVDYQSWDTKYLTDLVDVGDTERTFLDFAQKNVIKFEDSELVADSEREVATYEIANANIEREKVLYTIPFSEGGGSFGLLVVNDAETEMDKYTIGVTGGYQNHMAKVILPKNTNVQQLADTSTQTSISVKMPLWQYQQLDAKNVINALYHRWIWREMVWNNGIVYMTLISLNSGNPLLST